MFAMWGPLVRADATRTTARHQPYLRHRGILEEDHLYLKVTGEYVFTCNIFMVYGDYTI